MVFDRDSAQDPCRHFATGGRSGAILEPWAAQSGAEILLVEDDRQLARMLTTLLAEEGYRVQVAGDGQAGLHLGLTGDTAP